MDNDMMDMMDMIMNRDVRVQRKNKWEVMRDFLNRKGTGYWVTRGELIHDLPISISTIDNYRNHLTKAGYLSKRGMGLYIIEKEIPMMSLTDIRNEALLPLPDTWDDNYFVTQSNYYIENTSSSSDFTIKKKGFLTKKDFEL